MPSDSRATEGETTPERIRKAAEEAGRLEGNGDDLATAESISKSRGAHRAGFFRPSTQNIRPVEIDAREPGSANSAIQKSLRHAGSNPEAEYLAEEGWAEDREENFAVEKGTRVPTPAQAMVTELSKMVEAFHDAEGRYPDPERDDEFRKAMAELVRRRTGTR